MSAPELTIIEADNLPWLETTAPESFDLIYIDPPFNTGRSQTLQRLETERDPSGDRTGFGGRRYRTRALGSMSYADRHDDYLHFLAPRLAQAKRVLTPTGSLFVHLDPRESHYVKIHLDELFGRASFMNEIVWSYDYGARSRKRWSTKHDVILWYAKDPKQPTYLYEEIDRIPYMAPKLVGQEKAARGKTPTDVWWNTIVSPTGKERTGYPTQKPLTVLSRIVRVHSRPGERVLDFFAGSGTTGEAAWRAGRSCVLVDREPDAIEVMRRRLAFAEPRILQPDGELSRAPEQPSG
jgi:site-specific DNA-methyltransferase (adenine-specific)